MPVSNYFLEIVQISQCFSAAISALELCKVHKKRSLRVDLSCYREETQGLHTELVVYRVVKFPV